ncbi:MAG: restriction endonuclease subunit S [Bacteroidota bacterium]
MIRNLKPYPTYKDSGVPWLGEVPEHWEIRRQRDCVELLISNIDKRSQEGEVPIRLCNYTDVYKNDRITAHLRFMNGTATHEEIRRFRLRVGDVVITKDSESWTDIGVPALVEYEAPDLVCGYHLAVLRPRQEALTGGFLLRAIESPGVAVQYHIAANGVTRYGLSHCAIKNVHTPVPPLPEQAAIVRLLDHVDRRIRRYIRAKKKLIALLNEQKQAIVHRAVTRGLDPNVRLKPSGVDWLGDVPEHWTVSRVKNEFECLNSRRVPLSGVERGAMKKRLFDYYGASGVIDKVDEYLFDDELLLIAEDGANLVLRNLPLAIIARGKFWVNNHAHVLKPRRGNSDFLAGLMESFSYLPWISGAAQPKLTQDRLLSIPIVVPPPDEQDQIMRRATAETAPIREAIAQATRQIALLREYRTRLIADVVTGKLDVREVAARLPEETVEPEPPDETEMLEEGEEAEDTESEVVAEEVEA